VDVHGFDAGVRGPCARKGDEPFDGLGLALEGGLDGSLRGVASPAGDTVLLGQPPQRVAEEDSLDAAVTTTRRRTRRRLRGWSR
jgi:hypothetical protein